MSVLVQKEAPSFTAAAIMADNEIDESFSSSARTRLDDVLGL